MQELFEFLRREFPNGFSIITPQFERNESLEYEWKPNSIAEFMAIAEKAPPSILEGFGFRKRSAFNHIIGEVQDGQNIFLFPGEWYDIIPDGFQVTGLYGEQYRFEKGKTDAETRGGCLSYGINRRAIS